MTKAEQLAVYTVPSTWTRPNFRPTQNPYQRIVGIPLDGEIIWVDPEMTADPDGAYSDNDVEEVLIPNRGEFGQRLVEYFARYIAGCRGMLLNIDSYNCHHFGLLMEGLKAVNEEQMRLFLKPPNYLVKGQPLTEDSLGLGQKGVIGVKFRGHSAASHTIVGLGRELSNCIQVMGVDSHLGIQSYADTIAHYHSADYIRNPDFRDFGIYV